MTAERPTVSVIIPALNEEASIVETILAARAAGSDEVIVVDGGSRDRTHEAARAAADVALSLCPGRAAQMNAGARASAGDILFFLHADTRPPAGSLDAVRRAVRERGCLGGAFSVRLGISPGASPYVQTMLRLTGMMINLRSRLFRSFTGDQGIFVRRDVFESVGGFPEIPLMEDVAFSRGMVRRGRTALIADRIVTSGRRWESSGPLRTILLMWGLRLGYCAGMSPGRCAQIYGWSRGR